MSTIISVATQKGGVGKTTTVVNLAHALSIKPWLKKVLVIDLDPQANASSILGLIEPENQLLNITMLFEDEKKNASDCTVKTKYRNIDLIPSRLDLFVCGNTLGPGNPASFMCLTRKLDKVTLDTYDYILIDCPPNIGGPFLNNALSCSDYYIIPVESSSIFSLNGVQQFMEAIASIRGYTSRKLAMLGILLTMFEKRTTASTAMLPILQEKFGKHLFKTMIYRNTDIDKAHMMGTSVIASFPRTTSAKAYKELAIEVLERCSDPAYHKIIQQDETD